MFKICPICQQQVAVYEWAVHEMQHRSQPQPSAHQRTGPQAAAMPQAAKAPRIYHHPRCGHATALPEAAVYAQLQDPFCSSDQSYCSGCKGYVSTSELFWEGSSESLLSYDRRQKAEYIRSHALNPNDFVWDSTGPVRRKSKSNAGVFIGLGIGAVALVFVLGVGLAIALVVRSARNAAPARQPAVPVFQPAAVPVPQPARNNPIARRPNPMDELRVQQDDIFAEMRKHQEEARRIMEQAQPRFEPPAIQTPPSPFGNTDPIADANRRMEEARQRSQKMHEEFMERSRQRREESMRRLEEIRSRRFP